MLRATAARTRFRTTAPTLALLPRAAQISSSATSPAPTPSTSTAAASISTTTTSTSTASASTSTSTSASALDTAPSHFLVTLLRSPLHLAASQRASAASLGLYQRLSSSLVPVTAQNAGYLLRLKELVGVCPVSPAEVAHFGAPEWRNRPGAGRQGSGLRVKAGGNAETSVIRVGSERARGEERGFRVVSSRDP